MADLNADIARLVSTHGVEAVKQATSVAASAGSKIGINPGTVASYIKEIITGDQAFDEKVLARVSKVLSAGGG